MGNRNRAVPLLGLFTFGALLISAASKPEAGTSRSSELKSTSNLGGQVPASFDQGLARVVAEIDRIEADTLSEMKDTSPNLGSGLMRISPAGGSPQTLTMPDTKSHELSHRWPQVLPGNNAVLFTIQTATQATYDDAGIAVLSLRTGKWRMLLQGGSYARYVSSGHILYAHAGALLAVPFDLQRLQIVGSPAPVLEGVVTTPATSGGAEYDVSGPGLLAYVPGSTYPPERSLVWVDRQGVGRELPAPQNDYLTPRISPDGKLAVVTVFMRSWDLWIYEFERKTLMRFTFYNGGSFPVWTPDSQSIVYTTHSPLFSLRLKRVDGRGNEQTLLGNDFDDPNAAPLAVSPNSQTLMLGRNHAGVPGVDLVSLDGSGKIQTLLQSRFIQTQAEFSPDGHWVAYMSNESGRDEIYVQPYPGLGGKRLLSTEGGTFPRWARNGREIFYRNEDKIMNVSLETQPAFKAGTPRVLFQGGGYLGLGNYDVAPDGQHFLMLKEKDAPASSKEVSIVLNWTDELKRRVPTGKK